MIEKTDDVNVGDLTIDRADNLWPGAKEQMKANRRSGRV